MSLEFPSAQLDTDILIKEVKARPCLYAKDNLKYCDVYYKRAEWEKVAEALFANVWDDYDEEQQDDTVELVQRRWKNLRACFAREVKRQKDPKWIYGVAYKRRKYLYFDALSFLKYECDTTDEDTTHDIDLPEKTEADNTTVNVDTNIEELPLPEIINIRPVTFNTSTDSDNTKPSTNSDNTKLSSNAGNEKASFNSNTSIHVNDPDSTNFALSLVPMLNMIPIHERVGVQIEILSVLQPFMKKGRNDGENLEGDGRKRRISISRQTYGK